ncbi:MAG: ABC transporter substrate-binding protein [Oscillospiraceae bacterium]
MVPNALTVQHALGRLDTLSRQNTGNPLRWSVSVSGNGPDVLRPERFPGGKRPPLCAVMGLSHLLNPSFQTLFLNGTESTSLPTNHLGPKMAGALDPKGKITLYSISPFLLLADRNRLGKLPLPRRWADLMDPMYRGQIVTTGKRTPDSIPYFYFYQLFGKAGMDAFGKNVKGGTSPARMAMEAGSSASMGGLFVLPWFFAKCCPRRESTQIIWPSEGAFAYPLLLLAQKELPPSAQLAANYFMGETFGRESGRMCLPTIHQSSERFLPKDKQICFFDWSSLRTMDLSAYQAAVGDLSHVPALGEKTDWGKH